MNRSRRNFVSSTTAAVATASTLASAVTPTPVEAKTPKASKKVQSISAMAFAPDGKLVVADWRSGALHSLELPALPAAAEASFNVLDLSERLAIAYRLDASTVRVTASALNAKAQVVVLGLALGRKADAPAGLALVDHNGQVKPLDLDAVLSATQSLGGDPGNATLWSRQPARSLLVTDMKVRGNELFVAGLTNSSFDSTLRRLPYPFSGAGSAVAVEMYHASTQPDRDAGASPCIQHHRCRRRAHAAGGLHLHAVGNRALGGFERRRKGARKNYCRTGIRKYAARRCTFFSRAPGPDIGLGAGGQFGEGS